MKKLFEYGHLENHELEQELLPWIDYESRLPFKIWLSKEEISPFFIIQHHPYSISVLLKLSDNFKADVFREIGLAGNSDDWKKLTLKLIEEYEKGNSGIGLFRFDCDEKIFCIFSLYVDDLMKLVRDYLIPVCNDEKSMIAYLNINSDLF